MSQVSYQIKPPGVSALEVAIVQQHTIKSIFKKCDLLYLPTLWDNVPVFLTFHDSLTAFQILYFCVSQVTKHIPHNLRNFTSASDFSHNQSQASHCG